MRYFLLPLIVFFVSSFSCTSSSPVDEGIVETKPDANVHDAHFVELESEYSNETKHEDSKDIHPDKPIKEITPKPELIIERLRVYCYKLILQWNSVVKKYGHCQSDDDCVLLGFHGNCSCSYGPGYDGSPVNKKAQPELEPIEKEYLARCRAQRCDQDVSERKYLRCEAGRCKADRHSCFYRDPE